MASIMLFFAAIVMTGISGTSGRPTDTFECYHKNSTADGYVATSHFCYVKCLDGIVIQAGISVSEHQCFLHNVTCCRGQRCNIEKCKQNQDDNTPRYVGGSVGGSLTFMGFITFIYNGIKRGWFLAVYRILRTMHQEQLGASLIFSRVMGALENPGEENPRAENPRADNPCPYENRHDGNPRAANPRATNAQAANPRAKIHPGIPDNLSLVSEMDYEPTKPNLKRTTPFAERAGRAGCPPKKMAKTK